MSASMSKGTVAREHGSHLEEGQSVSFLTCVWCHRMGSDREKGAVAGDSFTAHPLLSQEQM